MKRELLQVLSEDRDASKGLFWFICTVADGQLKFEEILTLSIPYRGNDIGIVYNSRKGNSFTHKNSWSELVSRRKSLRKLPWNYFPRGRVEILRNQVRIFMNPTITEFEDYLGIIKLEFSIPGYLEVREIIDNSNHYRCLIVDEIE